MTVTPTESEKLYNGDGATVAFPTVFVFNVAADIKVIERVIATGVETIKTLTTEYTVSGGGGAGNVAAVGTVTAVTAPASTVQWLIQRDLTEDQQTDLPIAGPFPSTAVEAALDKVTMLIQRLTALFGRSLKFPDTDPEALDPEIPNSVDRALKLLAFDVSGNPVVRDLVDGGSGTLSNVIEDSTPQLGGVLDTNGKAIKWSKGADVASAANLPVSADGNFHDVTGTTTVTSINTFAVVGSTIGLQFDDALVLTHHATNLILPGGDNITTAAGDIFWFTEYATADWVCVGYALASGESLVLTLPRSYGAGCTLSPDAGDTDHDVNVTAGAWRDSTNAKNIVLSSEITKMLGPSGAGWVVGDDNGGLDGSESVAGTPDASTTYHVWLILRSDTGVVDVLLSESATAPTMPTNYDFKRRIGSVITDSSANIIAFTQVGDEFMLDDPPLDVDSTVQSTSSISYVLTTPLGIKVSAMLRILVDREGADNVVVVRSLDQNDEAPSSTAGPLGEISLIGAGANETEIQSTRIRTDILSQVAARSTVSSTVLRIATLGWVDRRGRDD